MDQALFEPWTAVLLGLLLTVMSLAALLACAVALWRIATAAARGRRDATVAQLLAMFAEAAASVQRDPKALLVWHRLALNSRKLFPEAFAELDNAFGGSFPFTRDQLQAAHARCSSDWLAWERSHDAEFSLRSAQLEDEIVRTGGHPTALQRTRLAAVEQEKLERYQQRYEEYIKTAKALAAFVE